MLFLSEVRECKKEAVVSAVLLSPFPQGRLSFKNLARDNTEKKWVLLSPLQGLPIRAMD